MKTALVVLLLVALVAADVAPLLHADSPTAIPGSYLVILKDHLEITDRDAHILALQDAAMATGAKRDCGHYTYNMEKLLGFACDMDADMLKAQLAHPNVKYIEADQVMSINYQQEPREPLVVVTQTGATWGITRVGQRNLNLNGVYTYESTAGNSVDVYVIDTGILITHNEFAGRASAVFNSITNEANTDLNGHGTHCAGTIAGTVYGVAKQATLFAVKVLSASGSGTTAGVVAGVEYVYKNKRDGRTSIASMSLGGGASATLDNAIIAGASAGVLFVIAAGNDNANACNYSPARVVNPASITVGATANTDARSTFSNFGTCVSIFGPGTSITSAWIGSNTATNTISGTSMATPHVAGGCALYATQNANPTAANIKTGVLAAATPSKVTNPGTGSPNLLLYTLPTQQ